MNNISAELKPVYDVMFQRIFGKGGNEKITEGLLSSILGKEISEISLDVNKSLLVGNSDDKIARLDVRAKLEDGEDFDIEIQMVNKDNMPKRLAYYWSKIYGGKLKRGERYTKITPTTIILIANFNLKELKEIKKFHSIWNLREQEYHQIILTKDIEIHILEIPKALKQTTNLQNKELIMWLKFLVMPHDKEVIKMSQKVKSLKQAVDELENLKDDPDYEELLLRQELDWYDKQLDKEAEEARLQHSLQQGIQQGMQDGKRESQKEICLKLLKKKMSIKEIIDITELSKQEILEIKKTM